MTVLPLARPLVSNGFTLSGAPERLGQLVPTDPGRPRSELWEQFVAQGYLWLKGLLGRRAVMDFRRRYFAALKDTGLLTPDAEPIEGFYAGGGEHRELVHKITLDAVRWAAYESFCLAPPIWGFYEQFLQGPVYLHKRKMLRHTKPGGPSCTGAHYDLTYLRGGTDKVCTSWIPIGDVPVEMGGLVYLEGSDAIGRRLEAEFAACNRHLPLEERISAYNKNMTETGWLTKDLPGLADRVDARWLIADYEAGDMVVHSAYMIHAATQNVDPAGRMRLSTDIRYQRLSEAIDARWGDHWSPADRL